MSLDDLSLAAALLVPLSAANCIRRWGNAVQHARWLPASVAEVPAPVMAIGLNEPSPLFDPQKLATRAGKRGKHYLLSCESQMDYYPRWINKLHLRWLYRIYDEPKLFKRYFSSIRWLCGG